MLERATTHKDKSQVVMELINGKVLRHLVMLEAHQVTDPEIVADIKYVKEKLSVGLHEYR